MIKIINHERRHRLSQKRRHISAWKGLFSLIHLPFFNHYKVVYFLVILDIIYVLEPQG
jgi:hypothetical protein